MQGVAQEAKRDQITDQIVWQRHIEDEPEGGGSHGRSAGLCSRCQLEASTAARPAWAAHLR